MVTDAAYWNARVEEYGISAPGNCRYNAAQLWAVTGVWQDAVHGLARRLCPPGGVVLDVGCGTGRWKPFMERLSTSYTGVDISEAMIAVARREHPGGDFRVMNGRAIPMGDEVADFILCVTVLQHVGTDTAEALVAEMRRVARPNAGILLIENMTAGRLNANTVGRSADIYAALFNRWALEHSITLYDDGEPHCVLAGRKIL